MKYMGGKGRIASPIACEINNIALLENIDTYYEPFVGGGAVIEKVRINNRYGSDLNRYLIALYNRLQEPEMFEYPAINKEQYFNIRSNKDKYADWLVAWCAVFCSFNGIWFRGWGGDLIDKDGKYINKQLQSYKQLCIERQLLKDVHFRHCSYKDIEKPYHSIIYCDAPYIATAQYAGAEQKFNFEEYYNWLIEVSKDNLVLISEYRMNTDYFKSVKQFYIEGTLSRQHGAKNVNTEQTGVIEQLFIVRGGWLTDKYYSDDIDFNF